MEEGITYQINIFKLCYIYSFVRLNSSVQIEEVTTNNNEEDRQEDSLDENETTNLIDWGGSLEDEHVTEQWNEEISSTKSVHNSSINEQLLYQVPGDGAGDLVLNL